MPRTFSDAKELDEDPVGSPSNTNDLTFTDLEGSFS